MAGENIGGLQITIISPIKDKEKTDKYWTYSHKENRIYNSYPYKF